ncbi:MAG: glycosyltransferase family 4 protein, partial [Planctomycetia bacterium]|nr:glycosyltransferase family 4 protein [Planctomycetia bacterium]
KVVSCVTGPLQKQIVGTVGLPVEKAPIIWMGVDTDRFHDAGKRSHQPGKLHLTTVARLNAMKGHRFALAALRKAVERGCDIRYTIVGEGEFRPQIEESIRTLGLGDRVTLTGTQSEDAILELLQAVDAFILPSVGLGEAAPVSVMEAMACGLPVICSIIGGTPDMIASGVNGILTPQEDEKAIEEALVLLCQNVEERRRLGQAARQRAVEAFDARQTAGKLLAAMQGK